MNKLYISRNVKLLVCDMAGTTINEGGIVYKTLTIFQLLKFI